MEARISVIVNRVVRGGMNSVKGKLAGREDGLKQAKYLMNGSLRKREIRRSERGREKNAPGDKEIDAQDESNTKFANFS